MKWFNWTTKVMNHAQEFAQSLWAFLGHGDGEKWYAACPHRPQGSVTQPQRKWLERSAKVCIQFSAAGIHLREVCSSTRKVVKLFTMMVVAVLLTWNGFSWRSQGYDQADWVKKKKTTHSMQHGPLSARGELQSHPLAGQAQACGHPTQVDGPGARWHLSWPLADTTAQKT